MYYRVVEEKCYNGTKHRFSVNQRISDSDLTSLMNDFQDCRYNILDELNKKYYDFYKCDLFDKKINLYYLNLTKIR